ncbi:uncharacterized protein SPAPADRAFT_133020 [Spathaspora passalidarum NRRL Y-27907]|uniref:BZIP domain-containing protein n=1 Tax=Spathaspora passalidarum (strain NRRL Y-27907 / 11-Y1) TaxID=619300 RepID=G3AGB1_SPAPN|nr:uncharacterized protein SPAPADRAFT_133020 [Spathaspora passalidarum NRRL Y-27907]EGW35250.1 hypothetical protein SPAPADRAFT_133020 [Spathaspora passalidarum NRRL Y-27907]
MKTKGPSIAPRQQQIPTPMSMRPAMSPSSTASTPRQIVSTPPNTAASPPNSASPSANGSASLAPKGITQIITSKEWVLPPRPKPGRKPSVDTPASKRKAQNRAAQRAFRERRATRVQELEQKLMEVEKEKDLKEMTMINTINKLKVENQFLMKSLEQLKKEVGQIRGRQQHHQQQQQQQQPIQTRPPTINIKSHESSNHASPTNMGTSPASSNYSLQQISPAPSADSPPSSYNPRVNSISTLLPKNNTPQRPTDGNTVGTADYDCGICLKEECLCESVGLKIPGTNGSAVLEEQMSGFQPMPAVSLNRKRKATTEAREVDFTSLFSKKSEAKKMPEFKRRKDNADQAPSASLLHSTSESKPSFDENSPVENCGFCSDDTPCVCREAAEEAARLSNSLNQPQQEISETLPPIQISNSNNIRKSALPVMHPGPSVELREMTNLKSTGNAAPPVTVTSSTSSKYELESDSGCTGNPGTCRQCQTDPMSTLFCTTIASRGSNSSPSGQTPGRSMSVNSLTNPSTPIEPLLAAANAAHAEVANNPEPITPSSSKNSNGEQPSGIFIPVGDAYKTLSRHKQFSSVDFGTLVGKLTTRGMQVEVQSVVNVLRELDKRVYH